MTRDSEGPAAASAGTRDASFDAGVPTGSSQAQRTTGESRQLPKDPNESRPLKATKGKK